MLLENCSISFQYLAWSVILNPRKKKSPVLRVSAREPQNEDVFQALSNTLPLSQIVILSLTDAGIDDITDLRELFAQMTNLQTLQLTDVQDISLLLSAILFKGPFESTPFLPSLTKLIFCRLNLTDEDSILDLLAIWRLDLMHGCKRESGVAI